MLLQVLLDETRTEVHVDLDERSVTNKAEAMDLAGLDYKNVTGPCFEFLAVDVPQPTAFPHELDFVVTEAAPLDTLAPLRFETHCPASGLTPQLSCGRIKQIASVASFYRSLVSFSAC